MKSCSAYSRSVVAFALAVLLSAWAAPANASSATRPQSQPSWFPNVPCEAFSHNGDPFAYDHARDSDFAPGIGNRGYSRYQARVMNVTGGKTRKDCHKEWTVLVYMAADNDLHPYALWDLHEMEGAFAGGKFAASTRRSDLVVEADLGDSQFIRRFHMFQRPGTDYRAPRSKTEFERAPSDKFLSPVVESRREARQRPSVDHNQRLAEFLRWGMRQYPAKQYFVIVWGHGQGWAADPARNRRARKPARPGLESLQTLPLDTWSGSPFTSSFATATRGRFGGLAFENLDGDYLGIPALGEIFRKVTRDTLENRRKIDVYASDACLMQMTEVAFEVSDSTRFIVGSSDIQTLLGLPYRRLMYELNTGRFLGVRAKTQTDDEAHALAKMLPTLAMKSLDPRRGDQGRADKAALESFTMSSLSSDELRTRLAPALRSLGNTLALYLKEDPARAMDLFEVIDTAPGFMGGAKDLGSFLGLLSLHLRDQAQGGAHTPAARRLHLAVNETRTSLNMTVVESGFGFGFQKAERPLHLLGFKAVGIWLPLTREEYTERSADFAKSRFFRTAGPSERNGWSSWLRELHTPSR